MATLQSAIWPYVADLMVQFSGGTRDLVPVKWILDRTEPSDRSRVALEIGAAIADGRLVHHSDGGQTSGAVAMTDLPPLTHTL